MRLRWKKNANMQTESLRVVRAELKKLTDQLRQEKEQARAALVSAEAELANAVAHAKKEAKIEADSGLLKSVTQARADERALVEKEAEAATSKAIAVARTEKEVALKAAANDKNEALVAAASEYQKKWHQ